MKNLNNSKTFVSFLKVAGALIPLLLVVLPGTSEGRSGRDAVDAGTTRASIQHEINEAKIAIQGEIVCEMPEVNTGEPCQLKVKESKTGMMVSLENANEVRRLYANGSRQIAIEGLITRRNTLDVTSANAL